MIIWLGLGDSRTVRDPWPVLRTMKNDSIPEKPVYCPGTCIFIGLKNLKSWEMVIDEKQRIGYYKIMKLSDTLRNEIKTCGISRYRISEETGIDAAALCRFLQGGSLKIETVEVLMEYFNIEPMKRKRGR